LPGVEQLNGEKIEQTWTREKKASGWLARIVMTQYILTEFAQWQRLWKVGVNYAIKGELPSGMTFLQVPLCDRSRSDAW